MTFEHHKDLRIALLRSDVRLYSYLAVTAWDVADYERYNAKSNDARFELQRLGVTDVFDNRDHADTGDYACNVRRTPARKWVAVTDADGWTTGFERVTG